MRRQNGEGVLGFQRRDDSRSCLYVKGEEEEEDGMGERIVWLVKVGLHKRGGLQHSLV